MSIPLREHFDHHMASRYPPSVSRLINLPGIGKNHMTRSTLTSFGENDKRVKGRVTHRLRTKIRLYEKFKARCKQ